MLNRRPTQRRSSSRRYLAAVVLPMLAASVSQAATLVWDGGAGTIDMSAANNWNPNAAPSVANGDILQWDGSIAGNLSLITGTGLSGFTPQPGLNFNVTSTQTSSLLIDAGTNSTAIRMNTITIAAGAGAFTFGDGTGATLVTLGGAAGNRVFTNDSSSLATLGADLRFQNGAGAEQTITLTGAGNWLVNNTLASFNSGVIDVTKSGSGTATLAINSSHSGVTTVSEGTLNVNGLGNTAILLTAASGKVAVLNSAGNVTRTNNQTTNIGTTAGGTNILNITAGTWSGGSGTITAGSGGHGVINLSGGSVTPGGNLLVGAVNGGATGIVSITGGSISITASSTSSLGAVSGASGLLDVSGSGVFNSVAGSSTAGLYIGESGTGILNVSGTGAVNAGGGASGSVGVTIGRNAGATGIVNLGVASTGGGLLTTNVVQSGSSSATSIFNFHGGTLRTSAANVNSTFMSGLTAAYVYSEGGTVDNNGKAITISQALLAPTGSGITSISLSGDTTGFTPGATPLVTLSGDGTGATAVAKVDGSGNLTVVITNPGTGYSSAPTVTFTGTGSRNPSATASIGSNSSGGLNFVGAGTTTLSGANTYTGSTNASGGGSLVVNGSLLGTTNLSGGKLGGFGSLAAVVVSDNSANALNPVAGMNINSLTFNGAASVNFNIANTNAPLVTSSLTTGAGVVTINVANTSSWVSGTYNLIQYSSLGGAGFSAFQKGAIAGLSATRQTATLGNTGSFITLTVSGDSPFWTGALNGNWTTATLAEPKNWKLPSFNTTTDFIAADVVTFDDTATGTTIISISDADVAPASVLFSNSSKSYTIGGPFGITGAGSVTLAGANIVRLASPNSYTGTTFLQSGTLGIQNASAIGSGTLAIAGGTLDNTSGSALALSTNNPQTWSAPFTFAGSNDLDLGAGAVSVSGEANITTNGASTLAVGGSISGATNLVKLGTGKLKLSGTNAFGGALVLSNGILEIAGGATTFTANDVRISPNLGDSGTLLVSGGTLTAPRIIIAGTTSNSGNPSNGVLVQTGGTIVSNQWFTVGSGVSAGDVAVAGVYTNSGGKLNVLAQLLEVANFGNATGTINLSGAGEINMYNNTSIVLGSNNNAGDGTINQNGGKVAFYSDAGTTSGGTGTLLLGRATTLSSTQTYNLNGGTLSVGFITSNSSNGANAILNLNGGTLKAAKATTNWITNLDQINVQSGGAILDDGGFAVTLAQDLNSSASPDGGLAKTGAGTLTYTGNANYNGPTTISAGKFVLSGSGQVNSSSAITVNGGRFVASSSNAVNPTVTLSSGAVDGTGTINNVIVANNAAATVSNGNGAAAPLFISNLTFNGAANLALIMDSTNTPALQVGNLTVNGTIVVNASNNIWTTGSTYHLATYSTLAGSLSNFVAGAFGGLSGHQSATLVTSNTGFIDLVISGGGIVKWTGAFNNNWTTTQVAAPENWLFNSATSHFFANDVVLFDDSSSVNNVNISDANVAVISATFNNSTKDYTISSTGNFGITGGDLVKTGTGALTLLTNNSYAGTTSVAAGSTLNVGNAGTTGSLGSGSVINNGTLRFQRSDNITFGNDLTGTGNLIQNGAGSLTLAFSSNSYDGAITVNAGTLVPGSDNAFGTTTGGTTVNAGASIYNLQSRSFAENLTLNGTGVGGAGALRAGANSTFSGNIFAASNTSLGADTNTTLTIVGPVSGSNRTVTLSGAGNFRFQGDINLGASGELALGGNGATFNPQNNVTVSSKVSGPGTLTLDGYNNLPGTTTLSAANTFSGGVNIIGGSVLATNSQALGTGTVTLAFLNTTVYGGSLLLQGNITITNPFADMAGRQAVSQDVPHIRNLSGNNTITANIGFTFGGQYYMITSDAGTLTFNGNLTQTNAASERFWRFNGDGNGVVQGNIAQAGLSPNNIIKQGAGTWTFNGTANTYAGTTTVEQGTLAMKNVGTTSAININAGTFRYTASNGVLTAPVNVSGSTGNWNGQLDITSSTFLVQNPDAGTKAANYATLLDQIQSGKSGGTWTGNGITSSSIPGNPNSTLAIADNADLGWTSLGSTTLDSNSILITRAIIGDVNLDGNVDLADYDRWYKHVGTGTPYSYAAGDINMDGNIDLADYDLWYKHVGAAPLPIASQAALGGGIAAVPEPASLAVLALGAAALLGSRRRRQ